MLVELLGLEWIFGTKPSPLGTCELTREVPRTLHARRDSFSIPTSNLTWKKQINQVLQWFAPGREFAAIVFVLWSQVFVVCSGPIDAQGHRHKCCHSLYGTRKDDRIFWTNSTPVKKLAVERFICWKWKLDNWSLNLFHWFCLIV